MHDLGLLWVRHHSESAYHKDHKARSSHHSLPRSVRLSLNPAENYAAFLGLASDKERLVARIPCMSSFFVWWRTRPVTGWGSYPATGPSRPIHPSKLELQALSHGITAMSNQATAPPSGSGQSSAEGRLDSWKEIAVYLRREVRTVQRWEKSANLPVHRLQLEKQSAIYAYKSDLAPCHNNRPPHPPSTPHLHKN